VQLQQLLSNLMINAIDAMHHVVDRPRTLRVQAEYNAPESAAIAVEDSGPGIDSKDRERIFSTRFSAPRPTAWVLAWQSAAQSLNRMVPNCEPHPMCPMVRFSTSDCPKVGHHFRSEHHVNGAPGNAEPLEYRSRGGNDGQWLAGFSRDEDDCVEQTGHVRLA
jgi:hypothetical protein